MWAKACAVAPLMATSVPMPTPVTMKPTWLTMWYASSRRMSLARIA